MKKILSISLIMVSSLIAETFTMIIPQPVGAGTSQWATIVAKEMEKFLPGDRIVLRHIPGAREIPGFNKFENELQKDDNVMMVSHGANAVSFLEEKVDYNYNNYDSIGLMNLDIIAGLRKGANSSKPIFRGGPGADPEAFAMTMLNCGPNKSVDEYIECFKENVVWVKGMSSAMNRLAFARGEVTGTRENPAAFIKHVQPLIDKDIAQLWFTHGILQPDGSHSDDPNYPGYQMEILFEKKYGVRPSGELYDAYKLIKSFRDGMQKAIWIRKNNPNRDKLVRAIESVSTNPESIKVIQKKVGNYQWIIGDNGNLHRDMLMKKINEKSLYNLVKFNKEALGVAAVYKSELIKY